MIYPDKVFPMAKDIEIRTTDGLLYKGKVNGRKYCLTIKPPPKVKKPRKKKAPLAGLPEQPN
jgi:hypothetical protein